MITLIIITIIGPHEPVHAGRAEALRDPAGPRQSIILRVLLENIIDYIMRLLLFS